MPPGGRRPDGGNMHLGIQGPRQLAAAGVAEGEEMNLSDRGSCRANCTCSACAANKQARRHQQQMPPTSACSAAGPAPAQRGKCRRHPGRGCGQWGTGGAGGQPLQSMEPPGRLAPPVAAAQRLASAGPCRRRRPAAARRGRGGGPPAAPPPPRRLRLMLQRRWRALDCAASIACRCPGRVAGWHCHTQQALGSQWLSMQNPAAGSGRANCGGSSSAGLSVTTPSACREHKHSSTAGLGQQQHAPSSAAPAPSWARRRRGPLQAAGGCPK
jgi:hypothetical protein